MKASPQMFGTLQCGFIFHNFDGIVQAFECDGAQCVMTGVEFNVLPTDTKYKPVLSHIIPNSIHAKVWDYYNSAHLLTALQLDTLKCLSMFASKQARDLVKHLNGIGNVMNFESNAHLWYDKRLWCHVWNSCRFFKFDCGGEGGIPQTEIVTFSATNYYNLPLNENLLK